MTDYIVEVKYIFHLKAEDEEGAMDIADNAVPFIVKNPQTGKTVYEEVEAYEET